MLHDYYEWLSRSHHSALWQVLPVTDDEPSWRCLARRQMHACHANHFVHLVYVASSRFRRGFCTRIFVSDPTLQWVRCSIPHSARGAIVHLSNPLWVHLAVPARIYLIWRCSVEKPFIIVWRHQHTSPLISIQWTLLWCISWGFNHIFFIRIYLIMFNCVNIVFLRKLFYRLSLPALCMPSILLLFPEVHLDNYQYLYFYG